MRILITNDDGIWAPGLKVLYEIARELAGKDGEVWTVAPAFEQSGVGHCISYIKPMMISRIGPRRFAVDGSPADCVLAGLYEVMQAAAPDLVLSGVNRGNNSAENTLYSGTIGAVIEAALHGYKGIALSQFYGQQNKDTEDAFEAARQHGAEVIRRLLAADQWQAEADYRLFYNVNFPPVPGAEVVGTRIVTQGFRRETSFSVEPQTSPNKRKFLWIKGGPQHLPTAPGSDVHANLAGHISVTPMRADLTAHDQLARLQQVFD
jgi:5'/3'-nucleotidase